MQENGGGKITERNQRCEQWLSETGIQDLLAVLAERAAKQKKIILLADHRALDFGGFSGTITVTKNHLGSTISTV